MAGMAVPEAVEREASVATEHAYEIPEFYERRSPVFDSMTMKLLLAALGGSVGAACRVLVHQLTKPQSFPWTTFAINVGGSFLLGLLYVVAKERPTVLLLLGAGFCGGFTTFSTFSVETLTLIESERWFEAAAYAVGSVLAGLFAAWLGVQLGKGIT